MVHIALFGAAVVFVVVAALNRVLRREQKRGG